jgi:hypothetical protein
MADASAADIATARLLLAVAALQTFNCAIGKFWGWDFLSAPRFLRRRRCLHTIRERYCYDREICYPGAA